MEYEANVILLEKDSFHSGKFKYIWISSVEYICSVIVLIAGCLIQVLFSILYSLLLADQIRPQQEVKAELIALMTRCLNFQFSSILYSVVCTRMQPLLIFHVELLQEQQRYKNESRFCLRRHWETENWLYCVVYFFPFPVGKLAGCACLLSNFPCCWGKKNKLKSHLVEISMRFSRSSSHSLRRNWFMSKQNFWYFSCRIWLFTPVLFSPTLSVLQFVLVPKRQVRTLKINHINYRIVLY